MLVSGLSQGDEEDERLLALVRAIQSSVQAATDSHCCTVCAVVVSECVVLRAER